MRFLSSKLYEKWGISPMLQQFETTEKKKFFEFQRSSSRIADTDDHCT